MHADRTFESAQFRVDGAVAGAVGVTSEENLVLWSKAMVRLATGRRCHLAESPLPMHAPRSKRRVSGMTPTTTRCDWTLSWLRSVPKPSRLCRRTYFGSGTSASCSGQCSSHSSGPPSATWPRRPPRETTRTSLWRLPPTFCERAAFTVRGVSRYSGPLLTAQGYATKPLLFTIQSGTPAALQHLLAGRGAEVANGIFDPSKNFSLLHVRPPRR